MNNSNASIPNNDLAIRFIGDEEQPVTQETVEKLVKQIQRGKKIFCYCLALDEYGEEDFLTVDLNSGWAALLFNTYDDAGNSHGYQPINLEYEASEENAPVNIGGQTPVLKRNALNNLNLAAECVLYFAKTGRLYPDLQWEEIE